MVAAIIVAAGRSTRMGEPKQFITISGRPLIAHTLMAFESCKQIDAIVVVAQPTDRAAILSIAAQYGIHKLTAVTAGGETRQQSVHNGVLACGEAEYLVIHDGARPLITPDVIERVLFAAQEHGVAAAAVHTTDTVKVADKNGMVQATPDRSTLWNMQTPQIFHREVYERAWAHATEIGLDATDDCQLAEAIGHPVKLVESSYANIKITTPKDVLSAEGLLS